MDIQSNQQSNVEIPSNTVQTKFSQEQFVTAINAIDEEDEYMRNLGNMCDLFNHVTEKKINKYDTMNETDVYNQLINNIQNGIDKEIKLILESTKCNINMMLKKNSNGLTPLMEACRCNSYAVKQILSSDYYDNRYKYRMSLRRDYMPAHYDERDISERDYYYQLLSMSDINNNTPLMIACRNNPEAFNAVLESEWCDTNLILQGYVPWNSSMDQNNGSGSNLNEIIGGIQGHNYNATNILHLAINKTSSLRYLLKSPKCTTELLNLMRFQYNRNILMIACTISYSAVQLILDSDKCNEQLVYHLDDNEMTCYMIAAIHSYQALRYLLDSKFCNENILNITDNKNKSCIMYAAQNSSSSLSSLINSKWINKKMLQQTDESGNNIVMSSIYNGNSILSLMIEKNMIDKQILKITNKLGQNLLMILTQSDSEGLEFLLSHSHLIDDEYVKSCNPLNKNYNILMYAAQYNGNAISKILRTKWAKSLLQMQDSDGNTAVMIACQHNPHNMPSFANSSLCSDQIYKIVNNLGENYFMIAVRYQKILVSYILGISQCKYETFAMVDKKGNNIVAYFLDYCHDMFSQLTSHSQFKAELLKTRNKQGQNALMYACSKSSTTKNTVMNILNIVPDIEYLGKYDQNGDNALMISAINNPAICEMLMENNRISREIILAKNKQGMTSLMLACMKKKQSAVSILESCHTDYEYISQTNENGMNAFMIACQFIPEITVNILDKISSFRDINLTLFLSMKGSKLMTSPPDHLQHMFTNKYYGFTALHICAIYNGEYIKALTPFISDEIGLIKDSNNKRYYDYICEAESNTICQICFTNRKNCAVDCGHIFCEQCTHIDKCYMCKAPVTERKKVYI